jgi:hypothetical protein
MLHLLSFRLGLILLALGPLMLGQQECGAVPGVPAVLEREPLLESQVSVAVRDRPLGEWLAEFGKELKVQLAATRETADDRISLFIRKRPAREVLALVAEHFDFQWRRERGALLLTQDLPSRNREAALRERDLAEQLQTLRRKLDLAHRFVSRGEEEQLARLRDILRRAAAARDPDEQAALQEEYSLVLEMNGSLPALVASLYPNLAPEDRQRLWSGEPLEFSTADGTLPRPWVAQIDRIFSDVSSTGGGHWVLRMDVGRGHAPGSFSATKGDPRLLRFEANLFRLGSDGGFFTTWALLGRSGPRLPAEPTVTDDPLLLSPAVSQWRRKVEDGLTRAIRLMLEPSRLPADPTLGEVLESIHPGVGVDYIADSYVRSRLPVPAGADRLPPMPLVSLLDRIRDDLRYRWEKRGDVIFLRSESYPEDRLTEIPDHLLQPYRERASSPQGLTLDDFAALARNTSDLRFAGLVDYWDWYFEGTGAPAPDSLERMRPHLWFWSTLDPARRQAALGGRPLLLGSLTPLQQAEVIAALRATPPSGILRPVPAPPEIAAFSFVLSAQDTREPIYYQQHADDQDQEYLRLGFGFHDRGAPPGFSRANLVRRVQGYDFGYTSAPGQPPFIRAPFTLQRLDRQPVSSEPGDAASPGRAP